jgi:hypothetical protein
MKPKKSILCLDVENGFFVKPEATKKPVNYPVVSVGSFKELKRQSDILNFQFELH